MRYLLYILGFLISTNIVDAQSIKIMLVTGGHGYDTVQFFQLFDEMEEIEYIHYQQPEANSLIAKGEAEDFDVLVFYDMWKSISEREKRAYLELSKQGKPFLFLHHSLASYQNWPEFEKIIGGKYIEKGIDIPEEQQSTYEHDVWVYYTIEKVHPVTKGLKDLRFFDEVYGNVRISENVIPLLRTTHPQSSEYIAWINRFNLSEIIYLQPGHDYRTYESGDYRKLLMQSIKYLAKSN